MRLRGERLPVMALEELPSGATYRLLGVGESAPVFMKSNCHVGRNGKSYNQSIILTGSAAGNWANIDTAEPVQVVACDLVVLDGH